MNRNRTQTDKERESLLPLLRELGAPIPLERQHEADLVRLTQDCPDPEAAEVEQARTMLLRASYPRILALARRKARLRRHRVSDQHRRRDLLVGDLFQEGVVGFLNALPRFDRTRNIRLWTYAKHDVVGAIQRAIHQDNYPTKTNRHIRADLVRYRTTVTRLAQRLSHEPSRAEIADALNVSDEHVDILEGLERRPVSLDASLPESPVDTVEDICDDGQRPARALMDRELTEQVATLLETLNPRSREVLSLRYGIAEAASEDRSLQEVAKKLGISRQAVHQIERAALARCRAAAEARGWQPSEGNRRHDQESSERLYRAAWVNQLRAAFRKAMRRQHHFGEPGVSYGWFGREIPARRQEGA